MPSPDFPARIRSRRAASAAALALMLAAAAPVRSAPSPAIAPAAAADSLPPKGQLVDGVAATVGHDVILVSDVNERLQFFMGQLPPAARDTIDVPKLRDKILESMIDDNLLVAEATKSGIEVTTGEVTEGVEKAVEKVRSNFPTEEAFEAQLAQEGLDMSALRQSYREIVRRQMLVQRVVQKEIYTKIQLSDDEVKKFYDERQADIPPIPAHVVLDHILIVPRPSAAAESVAVAKIASIRERLSKGEAFEDLAKKFSEAPGAERGGSMGTFRRGDLDPAFAAAESVAYTLDVGRVSEPVRTPLGLHLIRLDGREGDAVRASQILVRLAATADDSARAQDRAAEVIGKARSGGDFGDLAKQYSDDTGTRDQGGRLGTIALSDLSPAFRDAVEKAADGDVIGPLVGPEGLQILRLVKREGERKPTLAEVSDEIRQNLMDEKARDKYQGWVDELRKKIYIRVVRSGGETG